ncbi:MAG: hypothetical protein ACTSVW_00420 [Candidatus Njordarchaeales archaeon]
MKLEDAERIAWQVVRKLRPYCAKIEIVGSIRRRKPEVHDIDLVLVPADYFRLLMEIMKLGRVIKQGPKLIEVKIPYGPQVDIYIANTQTFETIKLIRTGSKEHNIKLCKLAREKGWQLKADGTGLVDGNGRVIANTESEILEKLLGKWVKPEERD